ncbi:MULTISPECIES: PTS system mannose/fructose/N-acetylgalactosamine-transporter subunit IIB [Atopobiaceae]|uniref:PTS system, mannose-specific IIB component n=1 Tax=Parafannyhessea umbonata TaxID=604330 RepID=A0A1H6I4Q8_9ACTN|nr:MULTISPECIES: PTS sugar transporter subunit IIB [Atopobiaceae]SEH43618.1 PTS system, mannose-specific IIB component [Parafannyhessea umbonata]SJZ58347.1 PTS system, mannose-specific IIB component [Olsenella sp. KH1P3]
MIKQLRVDDRLIHGQVALMWSKALGTKGIVVANDKAATSGMVSATLKMACPSSQRLLIKSVDDAIRIAIDPRGKDMPIFMLVDCVADALAVVRACPGVIGEVNVANVGRFVAGEKTSVLTSVELTEAEVAAARELCDCGVPVFHQVTPNDARSDVAEALYQLA